MVVYDVVVNGEVKETIRPKTGRLKNVYAYVKEQIALMKLKYGNGIVVTRRIVF
ncbi:mechanosensitive ion channel protein MscL [Gordoniibacillus kamchatkensis]|uniref:Mechanosensitive ion channel protein MscL n=1 Tax=Gordoniibacillus kamchatkensis TaxID=1590651 RepID=A0ABR5ADN5_9BACL|nr:mechanosensitive ion channel protein MscL [Paenibacillus sp. VKM B-2647]